MQRDMALYKYIGYDLWLKYLHNYYTRHVTVAVVFATAAVQQRVIVTEMPPEAFICCAVYMTFHSLYDSCALGHLSCLT